LDVWSTKQKLIEETFNAEDGCRIESHTMPGKGHCV